MTLQATEPARAAVFVGAQQCAVTSISRSSRRKARIRRAGPSHVSADDGEATTSVECAFFAMAALLHCALMQLSSYRNVLLMQACHLLQRCHEKKAAKTTQRDQC